MTTRSGVWSAVVFAALLCAPSGAAAQGVSPSLGTAGTYSVLAGSAVTNTGATTINGDVGISPGIGALPHFTGFGTVVFTGGGSVHDADVSAANAQADKNIAFGALDQACNFTYAGAFKELAGQTLGPGVHCATSFHLTGGTLTLAGAAGDTWIFKSASDLIITGGLAARVISPSCNVWWREVSSATFDANSSLVGNILADTSVTLAAGATLVGRALARTAEVTLSSNTITACVPAPPVCPTITVNPPALPDGRVAVAYSQALSATGGTAPYTFTRDSGSLPPGLTLTPAGVLSGTPTLVGTFTFTIRATAVNACFGTRAFSIIVAPPTPASCPTIGLSAPVASDASGRVGVAYSQTISKSSGGILPHTFSVSSGAPPPGLTLSATGVLSGTPTTAGAFTFTLRATDANTCFGELTFPMVITAADDVPTLPQMFVVLLAFGLLAVGYARLRGRARAG